MPGDVSKKVFMYNKDKPVLMYSSDTFKDLLLILGIRHFSIIGAFRTGSLYLPFGTPPGSEGKVNMFLLQYLSLQLSQEILVRRKL